MANAALMSVEPVNAIWGEDIMQVQTIRTIADVSGSLNNKYFYIYTATNAIKYYVWFNVNAAGVDPAPAGATEVEIALATNASANTVASAVQSALDALAGFVATVSTNVVTVTNASAGYASPAGEGVGSNFVFTVTTQGNVATDLGYLDGSVTITQAPDLLDVTAHQTGSQLLTQIVTGVKVSVSLTIKEVLGDVVKKLQVAAGSSYIPVGANATEMYGIGTQKNFSSLTAYGAKLVLHPSRLPTTDYSRDIIFHKSVPIIGDVERSGEDLYIVPVTFSAYLDSTKHSSINVMAVGDSSQTLT